MQFASADVVAGEQVMLELGRKYGQAALYRHHFDSSQGKFFSAILPCMDELEAMARVDEAQRIKVE